MDVEAHQNVHYDQTSDCQTFGSNIYSPSISRKVSIGVMLDSVDNTRYGAMKGNGVNMPNTEMVIPNVGNFTGEKSKVEGVTASFSMKQMGPEEVKCSQITKSFYQRTPNFETILQANRTSNLLYSTGRQDKYDGVECAPAEYSVQLFSNQTSIFHSSDCNQKINGITGKSKRKKEGTTGRVEEEFTFTTAREVFKSGKTIPQNKGNKTEKKTENLKMKLWEILATTSSPKTRRSGSQTRNMDEENVLSEQRFEHEDDKFVKTRQNSDTIETDSENPDLSYKRPVTRSWSRKRASAQMQPTKNNSCPSSRDQKKHQGKDIFSFEERWTGRQNAFLNGVSPIVLSKKSQKQNSGIGTYKICSYENDTANKLCQEISKTDIQPCDGETFPLRKKMGAFHGCLPDHHIKYPQTEKVIQEKESYESPTTNKTDKHGGLEGSANGNQQEDRNNPVAENVADPLVNFPSPTFGLKTTTLSSSPSSTSKTDVNVNGVSSPTSTERRFSLGIIRNLRTFQTSEPDCNTPQAQRQYSNMEELQDSLPRKAASFVIEKDAQDGLSDSSSEESKFQSSQGLRDRHTDEQESFMIHPIKRLCSHEGIKFNDSGPDLLSSKGAAESGWTHAASEQNKDGFVRAAELFALELGKLKSKLKSVASKKSSEILMSVAEEIELQLQNVHSQIQKDIGKLTSLSESKRKQLETRFEDQQKQLRLIHEKFKGEVNLHIQDCRSAIEGLEADRIEIKGALEQRRASHRKLLSQVEEGLEIQLNDAQRKITAIQESARGKLLQLKRVIAMCLKDDILN